MLCFRWFLERLLFNVYKRLQTFFYSCHVYNVYIILFCNLKISKFFYVLGL